MYKKSLLLLAVFIYSSVAFSQGSSDTKTDNSRMKSFIDALMKKMTLDEKLGQLNLLTPGGGIATGAVVSTDVEIKISKGQVG